MHDRSIGLSDLNQLRRWMESTPEVPETDWFKDFGWTLPENLPASWTASHGREALIYGHFKASSNLVFDHLWSINVVIR
jgi:hypothetical protein